MPRVKLADRADWGAWVARGGKQEAIAVTSAPLRADPSRLGLGLPRQLWLVEIGIFLNMVGYGAVLPFEIIYLHDGRGFSLSVAGLVVGAITGVAVVTAPLTGPLIDRYGV